MVHCNICFGDLLSKSVCWIYNSKNRSCSGVWWWELFPYHIIHTSYNLLVANHICVSLSHADDAGPELPTRANEEFRPFIRRLPEFKFWYSVTKSTMIALFCTFFDVFNVPVFWPILVMYFFTLFGITMKRQIKVRLLSICHVYFLRGALLSTIHSIENFGSQLICYVP